MIWDIRLLYKKSRWNGSEQVIGLVELLLSLFPLIGKRGERGILDLAYAAKWLSGQGNTIFSHA